MIGHQKHGSHYKIVSHMKGQISPDFIKGNVIRLVPKQTILQTELCDQNKKFLENKYGPACLK